MKTQVQRKTLNPEWIETFILDYNNEEDPRELILEIYDWDRLTSHDFLGKCFINLARLTCASTSKTGHAQHVVQKGGSWTSQSGYPQHSLPHSSEHPTHQCGNPYPQQPSYPPQFRTYQQPMDAYRSSYPSQQPPGYYSAPHHQEHDPAPRDVVEDLVLILPNETRPNIERVLATFDGDKEKALEFFLSQQMAQASLEQSKPENNLPVLGDSNQEYSSSYFDMMQHPPSIQTRSAAYGLRSADCSEFDPSQVYSGQGRKKALFIGINYFDQSAELKGCIPDVHRMKRLLTDVFEFPSFAEAMVCLTDDNPNPKYQPTRKNIIYAMKWLVADSRPGDIFFFHYSGHGAQVPDRDGAEDDSMDETILPVDFKTAGMITDDEISTLLVEPLCSGSRLTALMDCCHSGTGMDIPFQWNTRDFCWEIDSCPLLSAGDVQLFSGCMDSQTAADVQARQGLCENDTYDLVTDFLIVLGIDINCQRVNLPGGAMTTAFVNVLSEDPWGHSYPSLLEKIQEAINQRGLRNQAPQLSVSQRFDVDRPFNLTDIIPNRNNMLGRQSKRIKKPARQSIWSGGEGGGFMDAISAFLPIIGSFAGNWLLNEMST